jgi:peptide/nickel transport system permease protein
VGKVILHRLAIALPTLVIVSFADFFLVHLLPGDPAQTILGNTATQDQVVELQRQLHLTDPLMLQYWHWLARVVDGDLGSSLTSGQAVTTLIGQRVEVTVSLAVSALVLTLVLGIFAGVVAALRTGGVVDRTVLAASSFLIAVPQFYAGLLLAYVFAVQLPWFFAAGYVSYANDVSGWLKSMTLPAVTLALPGAAVIARQLRTELAGVLRKEYVEFAEAKGLPRRRVVIHHALRNSLAPVLTLLGLILASILGGSIIIEQIFALPGLGQLTVTALGAKDIPVIQALVLLSTVIVLSVNLLVDIAYAFLNPRVRSQ